MQGEVLLAKIVVKNDGREEEFDVGKMVRSMRLAAEKVRVNGTLKEDDLGGRILDLLQELKGRQMTEDIKEKGEENQLVLRTLEIGEVVERVLIEHGQVEVAQEFIRYRENKKHARQDKDSLGVKDDIGLSYNTLYILKRRYLKRNEKGEIVETPREMWERVAKFVAGAETTASKRKKWYKEFSEVMNSFEFTPGTRTIVNAGKEAAQLANCFVWPLDDDIDHIFEMLHKSTLIKKNGGGCGYNFSNIRPEGDLVGGIPELAVGPVRMIEMFDLMTSMFRQEGRYESGNMAILNVDHPDIFKFISAKQTDGYLPKTNISVGITDEFMEAAAKNKNWDLKNPRTGEVVNTVKAKSILDLMATMAWQTGDPGIINLSAINRGTALANPLLKKRGPIVATNPCGEEPLFAFESCNLGYINFTKFVYGRVKSQESRDKRQEYHFDFGRLAEVMRVAVRFMDNVVTASWFPVDEVSEAVRNHRRIGIGCVGWAETLAMLGIAYDSEEAFELAEKVAKTMYESGFEASCDLAEEKGAFPLVKDSIWAGKKRQPRNVALMTFPPSSSNAVICETSYGIEPYFALAYEQNVLGGMRLRTVVPMLLEKLKERGLYSEELVQKVIENHGSVQELKEIPDDLRNIFKTAHDIDWKDHIRMQAAFQKWTDNAITKTINMTAETTPHDIEEAYVLAWKLGCKGLTVYRDRTKKEQVFSFGSAKQNEDKNTGVPAYAVASAGRQEFRSSEKHRCPDCDTQLIKDKKCWKCKGCGWSTCEL